MDEVRLDQWLCAARIFKSRTLAQRSCDAGHVAVNGTVAKCSRSIHIGDKVAAKAPRGLVLLSVVGVECKRLSATLARALYEDHSPPPPPREPSVALRRRGAGRPTKHERRELDKLRGEFETE